jgi:hypothetical protein
MEKISDRNHWGTPRMSQGSLEPIIEENVNPNGEELLVTVILPRLAVTTTVFNNQATIGESLANLMNSRFDRII